MQYTPFVVGGDYYCMWGDDLRKRSLEFLQSLVPEYFGYQAKVHLLGVDDSEDGHRAALALRAAYHHSLETLFSLLIAAVQAPNCVHGWLQKCTTKQLCEAVQAVSTHPASVVNLLGWQQVTWLRLSQFVHKHAEWAQKASDQTCARFARLWQRLSVDILDTRSRQEYNSLKHGLRVSPGGCFLSVGVEDTPGVPAPAEKMITVGGSQFGTTFPVTEAVAGAGKANLHASLVTLNWFPELTAEAVHLIASSISNVVSCLQIYCGRPRNEVAFTRLSEPKAFDAPWSKSPGVTELQRGHKVSLEHIRPLSPEEIRRKLEASTPSS